MKNVFMLIAAMLCNLVGCTAQNQKYESLDVEAFEKAISDTSVIRLDVRTAEEYQGGHIAGAINIDVLNNDFQSAPISLLPKYKTIAFY